MKVKRVPGLENAWYLKEIASKGRREWKPEVGEGGGGRRWESVRRERTVPEPEMPARREDCSALTLLRPPEATRCCELGPGKDWEGTFSILDPWPGPCPGSAARLHSSAQRLWSNTSGSGSEAGQRPSPLPTSGVARGEARHDAARRGRGAEPTRRTESGLGRNHCKLRMPHSSCIQNFSTARRWQLFRG